MTWKKKTLLALLAATALVGVAASASAEDWDFFGSWGPQTTYVSHDDGDRGDNNGYYGQYRYNGYYGQYRNDRDRNHDGYSRGYYGNRDYNGGEHDRSYDWNRGYDNGYYQQDRSYRAYGEHRDRDESDDDD